MAANTQKYYLQFSVDIGIPYSQISTTCQILPFQGAITDRTFIKRFVGDPSTHRILSSVLQLPMAMDADTIGLQYVDMIELRYFNPRVGWLLTTQLMIVISAKQLRNYDIVSVHSNHFPYMKICDTPQEGPIYMHVNLHISECGWVLINIFYAPAKLHISLNYANI